MFETIRDNYINIKMVVTISEVLKMADCFCFMVTMIDGSKISSCKFENKELAEENRRKLIDLIG